MQRSSAGVLCILLVVICGAADMYAINTFLRVCRFLANSFIGLLVGFAAGYYAQATGIETIVGAIRAYFN